MSRNKILAIVTAVSVSACLYACGSDDDTQPNNTAGAAGHTGGKGGSGGKGGAGGGSGKGGSGNTGNEAGETSGGEGGAEANGGAGGDLGVGGDQGVAGDKNAGGEGGGGPSPLTLAEACAAACTPAHSVATCTTTQDECVTTCTSYTGLVAAESFTDEVKKNLNDYYLAAMSCFAATLPTTDKYACADMPTLNVWSPISGTTCEDEICKWTCYETDYGTQNGDITVWTRCCN